MSEHGLELSERSGDDGSSSQDWNDADSGSSRAQYALPPADQGRQAWLCLLGCFTANFLVWGLAFSYGVLQEYYTTHEPFSSHPGGIPAVGTTATGLGYLTMPLFVFMYRKFPRARTISLWTSLPCLAAALIGASFANTVGELIFFQGVLYALAGNALIVPTFTFLDEWFVRRKNLAIGIMWAGDGAGGCAMPLVLNALLSSVGFRWALRIIAGIIIVLTAPLLGFLKPRAPTSAVNVARPVDFSFLRGPQFWVLQFFNMLQALGFFLPSVYLPSYAQSLGTNSTLGSLTVLLMNLASVFGCISVGILADRFEITSVLLGISILATLAVVLIWGFSESIVPLILFGVAYGLTAGAYSTSWGGMSKFIVRKYEGADTSMLFGLLSAGRGIGAISSGPLSEALLNTPNHIHNAAAFAYGSKYAPIIIFSACTCMVGGGSWVFRRAGLI